MAGYPGNDTDLTDVLEPLLAVPQGDYIGLGRAVGEVADRLAMAGVMIVDALGRPASGVTDEQAVLGAIDTMVRQLLEEGELQQAGEYRKLIERVHRYAVRRRERRTGPDGKPQVRRDPMF